MTRLRPKIIDVYTTSSVVEDLSAGGLVVGAIDTTARSLKQGCTMSCGCARIKDLTGQRFGRLTVLSMADNKHGGRVAWRCLCDCGEHVDVIANNLARGNTESCGCSRIKDLTNKKFGELTAIDKTGERNLSGNVLWNCICSCGNNTIVSSHSLCAGHTKSCGCIKYKDLLGKKFGRLTVISEHGRTKGQKVTWDCICDCGKKAVTTTCSLINGHTQSCGCLRIERVSEACLNPNITDEERITKRHYPEYNEWRQAIFEIDNYTCQKCGEIGGRLCAHHIEGYANNKELRISLDNGITLCKKHHQNLHHLYGNDVGRDNLEKWMGEEVAE